MRRSLLGRDRETESPGRDWTVRPELPEEECWSRSARARAQHHSHTGRLLSPPCWLKPEGLEPTALVGRCMRGMVTGAEGSCSWESDV